MSLSRWRTEHAAPAAPLATVSEAAPSLDAAQTGWRAKYSRALLVGDLAVLLAAVGVAQVVRFGITPDIQVSGLDVAYPLLGVLLVAGWWVSLQIQQTRSAAILGHGPEEYQRVLVATFRIFAVLALLSVAFKIDASRAYLATAFPLGLVGLILHRKLWRVRLHRERVRGVGLASVLVVGGARSAGQLAYWFGKHPAAGFRVTGVWVPDSQNKTESVLQIVPGNVPVMSSTQDFATALTRANASTVVVTDTEHLGSETLRELIWRLDGTGIDLSISPNVLDVSSSRLHLHDISGMPMLHVSEPQYPGAARLGKNLFDRIGAALLILALSPLLIATALAVRLSSKGPIFYRQERVGRDGANFAMIKFRSMRTGADDELAELLAAEGKSLAELPKLTVDPRLTPIGAFIRRFSIDELPQLFNVLKGDMSLVGPRPQRDFEVEKYDHVATRRLRVRPGVTGLWQVSGRSDLPYAEAIRLDVHYVENWSIMTDLMILWRTFRAVLASEGAY